ncbi:MAG TPA: methyltransferase domain-containing protein [Myxococcales bacterium]|nr:methyltransferase domain-containing protein [Myxococcales bacterium]
MQPPEQVSSHATGPADDPAAYVGSIPEHYHRHAGPFLFDPYARELASRAAAPAPERLLETACGTGIATRRLRDALPEARLTATDLNEPMLAVARRTVGPGAGVRFQRADMTRLPFPDADFDALVCQFGLMFVPDKPAAAREARRVLRPGGRVLMATWRSLEHNPPIRLAHETVCALFPQEPPTFYRTQTGFGAPEFMTELLDGAGFEDIRTEVLSMRASAPGARQVALGLIEGFPVVDFIRARSPALVRVAVDQLTRALAERFGDAPVEATLQALVTTAAAPAV